ncbi:hypothetical protein GCM10025868_31530 [Angustibacter aerolatus]|uniref:YjeF C-terminal domain-containing protein n=1 Tax=Angustibacter aerolatus TaxID=1162965 RepID=A0ABQ6JKH1_9ACTN|nr:hypothetical protein GCM10025868_31530 [Angustibacter aerolatus]
MVSGGATTWTASPDGRLWRDGAGGGGLGTAGSGDVLAGVVAGLSARGAEPAQAAVWGAHLHGRAGDRLAVEVGPYGYLAREPDPDAATGPGRGRAVAQEFFFPAFE